jgi:uncharacterized protein (UPF0264 family)
MTKWLASVQSLDEAQALTSCLPDILDLKNPSTGALGALPLSTVSTVVNWLEGRCLTSATVGDLPMQADLIYQAVVAMAETGVDYVKVGLFSSPDISECLAELSQYLPELNTPLIAVLFAEQISEPSMLAEIKAAGFDGVMIDTATKNGQSLLDHWSLTQCKRFVDASHSFGMLCGLAGALRLEDINRLQPLMADYLGFRSALCTEHQRTRQLEPVYAQLIQQRLQQLSLAS